MDASILKSPIVWGGGAVLGLVLLATKGQAATQTAAANATAVNPTVMSASVAMNSAAMGAQVELAQAQFDFGKAQLSADVSEQALFYGYLKNQDDNQTVLAGKRLESEAGITNALITSSTAIIVDQSNNANRLALAYVDANKSAHTDNANVKIAKYQYKAQKTSAIAGAIGNVAGLASSFF